MKKIFLAVLLLSTFFQLSCIKVDDPIPEFSLDKADHLTAEEYEIFGVILERYSNAQLIVRQQTSVFTPPKENFELFFNLDRMSDMEATLYARYIDANDRAYLLDEKISVLDRDIKLMPDKEYVYYFNRDDLYKGWELFEKKYPDTNRWFFSFNKIGFNENKTQAIVGIESYWFMETQDGPTLKLGKLIYLEKKNEIWEEVGSTSYRL
jgi:hypothetical protein